MFFKNKSIFVLISIIFSVYGFSQEKRIIKGQVFNEKRKPLENINVFIEGTKYGGVTNSEGVFELKNVDKRAIYVIVVSGLGYKTQTRVYNVSKNNKSLLNFILIEELEDIDEVVVKGKTTKSKIEEKGFNVSSVSIQNIKTRSLEVNQILDKTPGVRVRTTGGVGSDFEYSLDGMSGNAIRFFIDGIPMDYYGSSFAINNLPISLINRINIYKGVVPVALGSDALGGAINIVTKEEVSNFAEVSYSLGSFNTHKLALQGQWIGKSGFTTKLSSFYTYSDNNYDVWGEGVFYADESTGFQVVEFTEDNPAERFNDDFKTLSAKLDLGYVNKKWTDRFFFTLLGSDTKKGVQTAQTMSRVFGRVRNNEQTIMPSIVYKKNNFLTKGLDVNAFAGYTYTVEKVIDTSFVQFDWRGEIIGTRASGGEIGYDGRSLYTQKDKSQIYRFNVTYKLPSNFKLGLNYLYSKFQRSGSDPFVAEYRIPYLEPQNIGTHFTGLSLETVKFNNKLRANIFAKLYSYNATINDYEYVDADVGYLITANRNNISNLGAGFALSYQLLDNILLKTSLEQATRMPSPTEALGDGVTISNNPFIKPEQSLNINLGTTLGRYEFGNHGLKVSVNTFYRNIEDKLLFTVIDARDNGQYQNIDQIAGKGAELELVYDFNQKLKFNLNGTYIDMRNNLEFEENGTRNIFYRDRMRNQPYFMTNAGLEYSFNDLIQKKSKVSSYIQSSYVHKFFLDWPSAGSEQNKRIIPSQFVLDTGFSYTFPSEKITLALDVSNLLNEQVYDNYRLQKPGRAFFLKVNYQILD